MVGVGSSAIDGSSGGLLASIVAIIVESSEKEIEGHKDELLEPEYDGRIGESEVSIAADIGKGESGGDAPNELNELSHRQVLLPLGRVAHGGHEVTPIHGSVNATIPNYAVEKEDHASLEVGDAKRGNNCMMLFGEIDSRREAPCDAPGRSQTHRAQTKPQSIGQLQVFQCILG